MEGIVTCSPAINYIISGLNDAATDAAAPTIPLNSPVSPAQPITSAMLTFPTGVIPTVALAGSNDSVNPTPMEFLAVGLGNSRIDRHHQLRQRTALTPRQPRTVLPTLAKYSQLQADIAGATRGWQKTEAPTSSVQDEVSLLRRSAVVSPPSPLPRLLSSAATPQLDRHDPNRDAPAMDHRFLCRCAGVQCHRWSESPWPSSPSFWRLHFPPTSQPRKRPSSSIVGTRPSPIGTRAFTPPPRFRSAAARISSTLARCKMSLTPRQRRSRRARPTATLM